MVQHSFRASKGFTIVELIIVVAVIGILATIGIISYGAIQANARDKTILSDLDGVAGELAHYAVNNNGIYGSAVDWYSPDGENPNIRFSPSSGNVIDVVASDTEYCIRGYNLAAGQYKSLATAYTKGSSSSACDILTASSAAIAGDTSGGSGEPVSFTTLTWTERASAGTTTSSVVASSADGMKLVLAPFNDYIKTSTNGGVTWTERAGAGQRNWSAIDSSADGQKLVAADNGGYIYTSSNGGTTWTERTNAGMGYWYDIAISSSGSKIVAADYDTEYPIISDDGGATWTSKTYNNWYGYSSVTCSNNCSKILAGTEGGYLYTSTDSGATWTERTGAGGTGKWYGVAISGDGSTFYALDRNTTDGPAYIYTSTDDGATWTALASAGSRRWYRIAASTDGSKLAVAVNYDVPFVSIDGGATWIDQFDLPDTYWVDIAASTNGAKIIIVDDVGSVYTGVYGP